MKIALAMMTALAMSACVSGARYNGPRLKGPEATAPNPFERQHYPNPVFTDHAGDTKPGQE